MKRILRIARGVKIKWGRVKEICQLPVRPMDVDTKADKGDHWKNSDQKHHWLAAALLDLGPRLWRVKGHRYLPQLKVAIQRETTEQ